MQALVRYAEARRRGLRALPEATGNRSNMTDDALMSQLDANGLTLPAQAFAIDAAAAADVAEKIGFPVALKIVSDDISHKTEAGGVRLNLADRAAVLREAGDLQQSLANSGLNGFLVQEMVQGLEMLVGVRDDADFGPLVVVGLGGVFVELFRDVSLRLAPVDESEARTMLSELRGAKTLDGFRGQAPRDVDALVHAIVGMSDFFLDNRSWLAEIEINPLIVLADGNGIRAVDVRSVRRE
jgi:succinyl-CoA synthetase beta subunit